MAQTVKNLPMGVWVRSLGWEDSLEEGMATHSNSLLENPHRQRSLVNYSPWGHRESDTTEWLSIQFLLVISIHRLILLRVHKIDSMYWRKSNWKSRTEDLIMLKQIEIAFHLSDIFLEGGCGYFPHWQYICIYQYMQPRGSSRPYSPLTDGSGG